MSSIKSKGSEAESIVFAYLRGERIYYQKHYPKAPGSPDIALPRKRIAVFIDGDFWHGHDYETRVKPRLYKEWWRKKISENMDRDVRQYAELEARGWKVLRVWESDILRKRTRPAALELVKKFLRGQASSLADSDASKADSGTD